MFGLLMYYPYVFFLEIFEFKNHFSNILDFMNEIRLKISKHAFDVWTLEIDF